MSTAQVGIVMGSRSDLDVMKCAADVLDELGISHEVRVLSAHRTPVETAEYARSAEGRGVEVLICGAGMAAALAGVMAGESLLPVIGVPVGASLIGLDALFATVQMPPGVPVATVAIGKAGAKNAAWLAARIIAGGDPALKYRLIRARTAMRDKVLADDRSLSGG